MAVWTTQRRVAAAAYVFLVYALLATAAMYLAGVLFLVLNLVAPWHADAIDIVQYWALYGDDERQRERLTLATWLACGGLLVVLPAVLVAVSPSLRSACRSRFAGSAEIKRAGLLNAGPRSIVLGRRRGRQLSLSGERSVLLVTRSGTGAGVVIPTLNSWRDSVVVLDIDGENYERTAGLRASAGDAVRAFSPFAADRCSHRWNPLSAVHASKDGRVRALRAVALALYSSGRYRSAQALLNEEAREMFVALGLLLLESPELQFTIGEMLRQSTGYGQDLKTYLADLVERRSEDRRPLSPECIDALCYLLSLGDRRLSDIVAAFSKPIAIFSDPVVDTATSGDDFSLDDVMQGRMSIYLRIPRDRLAEAAPLLELFFSELVSRGRERQPEQDVRHRRQCLLVTDVSTTPGEPSAYISRAVRFKGPELRLLTVVRTMSQLGVGDAQEGDAFREAHHVQVLYAPQERRDEVAFSAWLDYFAGKAIFLCRSPAAGGESVQQSRQIIRLRKDRAVVVLRDLRPVLVERIFYGAEAERQLRIPAPPAVPALPVDLHLASVDRLRNQVCAWRKADEANLLDLARDLSVLSQRGGRAGHERARDRQGSRVSDGDPGVGDAGRAGQGERRLSTDRAPVSRTKSRCPAGK